MKRFALIIGNTGGLPDTTQDIINFKKFLRSDVCGAKYRTGGYSEPIQFDLLHKLEQIRMAKYDFVIIAVGYALAHVKSNENIQEVIYESLAFMKTGNKEITIRIFLITSLTIVS